MKTAQDWIDELDKGKDQAFPNIARSDVVAGLKARIATPTAIDQANTSLCGAASLMFTLARKKPEVYAQYVTELYQTGKGTLGKLKVAPGKDCRSYKPSTASGIHPVDWVAMASLRDSENDFFDYDSPSVEAGGITMPGDLIDWFKDAGFSKDGNDTNLVRCKDAACLDDAEKKRSLGQTVCLFVNANMLSSPNTGSSFPDHWIVLTAPVTTTKGTADFKVFTWGSERSVSLSVGTLCKNFYGYISCS